MRGEGKDQLQSEAKDQLQGKNPMAKIGCLKKEPFAKINLAARKFTQILCPSKHHETRVTIPTDDVLKELVKKNPENFWLSGVECNNHGEFNFMTSDGKRTKQMSEFPMQDVIFPEKIKETRTVEVYHTDVVRAFKFFDDKNSLI